MRKLRFSWRPRWLPWPGSGWSAARAQQSDEALKATFERVAKIAQEAVDTTRFKKKPPYHIGVSAGYLSNSWILFLQPVRQVRGLAASGVRRRRGHGRGVQSRQAGLRCRGPLEQRDRRAAVLAGRREGDDAGAGKGGRQGHPDGQHRLQLHRQSGGDQQCLRRSMEAKHPGGDAPCRKPRRTKARSSPCCRSPVPRRR